jgi:hypothetical protein
MDKAQAKILIQAFAATGNAPELDDGEIDIILSQSKRPMSDGTLVNGTDYVDNYDANYGIMMAWEMKAGKAAGLYTFLAGGNQMIRSDMIRHCQQMADRWRRGIFHCVPIGSLAWQNYQAYLTTVSV